MPYIVTKKNASGSDLFDVKYSGNSFAFKTKSTATITPFVQPTMAEIQNNTIGGDAFATTEEAYYENPGVEPPQKFYYCFTNTDEWQINNVQTSKYYWAMWYNPKPMRLKRVGFINTQGAYAPDRLVLFGSNDNISWHELGVADDIPDTNSGEYVLTLYSNQRFYKYFKLYARPRNTTAVMIGVIGITADEKTEG